MLLRNLLVASAVLACACQNGPADTADAGGTPTTPTTTTPTDDTETVDESLVDESHDDDTDDVLADEGDLP